jgi:hypothetical protein
MDDRSDRALKELSDVVKRHLDEMRSADQKRAEFLQEQLSEIISSRIQDLIDAGVPISTIQECLRKATDVVPDSYAQDADSDMSEYADAEGLSNAEVLTVISLVDTDDILNVENGKIDAEDFIDSLIENRTTIFRGTFELIGYILSECEKFPEFDIVTDEGNIVADSDGEALIPEKFDLACDDGTFFTTGDPVIYKTEEDIRDVLSLISRIDHETFTKKFDVKKLIRIGAFPSDEPRVVKRVQKTIRENTWKDFLVLRGIYEDAERTGKLVVVVHLCSE